VIEAGRIAETGTHHELIGARGHYFNLYTRQFRQEQEKGAEALKILEGDAL
jgi:ATP-binding cassette subfamily B protein